MLHHTATITIHHPEAYGFVHLTPRLNDILRASGIREGMMLVNSMHITSSVFVNDNERGLHHDFLVWLEKLAPFNADPNVYHHNRTGEDNADAHLKRTIMGREVMLAVTAGKLHLGQWEEVFYGEFDGKRPKNVLVKIIGGG
jgi:secondary thiamine-phosphate synthase enzyme